MIDTEYFRYSNPNPAGAGKNTRVWNRGDCAVRAIAHCMDKTWLEAFDDLTRYARSKYYVLNDKAILKDYLISSGYTWVGLKPEKGQKRMTVEDFALSHRKGWYFVQVANHATAVIDGVILDTWNCGFNAVVGYIRTK